VDILAFFVLSLSGVSGAVVCILLINIHAISTRAGPAEDDPPLYKLGSKPVQAV